MTYLVCEVELNFKIGKKIFIHTLIQGKGMKLCVAENCITNKQLKRLDINKRCADNLNIYKYIYIYFLISIYIFQLIGVRSSRMRSRS